MNIKIPDLVRQVKQQQVDVNSLQRNALDKQILESILSVGVGNQNWLEEQQDQFAPGNKGPRILSSQRFTGYFTLGGIFINKY
ncbi:hypothetical protein [Pedobacter foliorum]|uniref:hypothetical protein n=1 Tax=Pedobacter foliorum TaxID=2739058 RepID=UPI001565E0CB|nr:hypothetical protein [Pedobacter foliorum]NRF41973.1 hypothetical protein [Pedobacter foliorum]